MTMNSQRFNDLMRDDSLPLTPREIKEGWHFCPEYDGLLMQFWECDNVCGWEPADD